LPNVDKEGDMAMRSRFWSLLCDITMSLKTQQNFFYVISFLSAENVKSEKSDPHKLCGIEMMNKHVHREALINQIIASPRKYFCLPTS
jgi:hypothetical protein